MILTFACSAMVLVLVPPLCTPGYADVERDEHCMLQKELNLPVYQWADPLKPSSAIIVVIHGMTLYSGLFDQAARYLAGNGYPIYAVDLRGFGRWWAEGKKDVDFGQSEKDIVNLATALRNAYPHVPVFVLGESLGGNIAIKITCRDPSV